MTKAKKQVQSTTQRRNQAIDVLRILACFMVILCHVHFPGDAETYSMGLARFAVPFFMMVTGWYIWRRDADEAADAAKRSFFFMLKITLTGGAVIAAVNTVCALIRGKSAFSWLDPLLKENGIRNFLLYNRANFLASVMWYLFAMVYVTAIYAILARIRMLKLGYWLILPLIVMNLVRCEILQMDWFYGGNWFYTGIPFVMLGSWLHAQDVPRKVPAAVSWLLIAAGIVSTVFEAKAVPGISLYFGTVLLVFGIFTLAVRAEQVKIPAKLAVFGAKCTLYIFLLHCSVRDLIYACAGWSTSEGPEQTALKWLMPFIVFAVSAVIAVIIVMTLDRMRGAQKGEDKASESSRRIKQCQRTTAVSLCVMVGASVLYTFAGDIPKKDSKSGKTNQAPLNLWTEDAPAKNQLVDYMKAVTKEGSADFIPVENRIAVFDLDGTLFCETDPNYFDYTLLVYRVLEDPSYKDKASDFERETAEKIVELNKTGKAAKGLEVDHGKAVASAFSGMTVDEFNSYIQEFKKQPMPSYTGMNRGGGFYQPMLQVVDYLQQNDFTVYVVSGTDRFIVRGIVDQSPLNVPNRQIIGSDETLVARDQGDKDGLEYVFDDDDELVLGGDFIIKNLKMNKVTVIMQEIGKQPVLSFGNSTGDSSMAEYVTSNNPYKSLAFMLCCDDTERENGNKEKADKMFSLCEQYDWVPVSMKNDWTTIYGEGVTRVTK